MGEHPPLPDGFGVNAADKCANCGSSRDVKLATPDLDIQPVPLCQLCRVLGLDWREKMSGEKTS